MIKGLKKRIVAGFLSAVLVVSTAVCILPNNKSLAADTTTPVKQYTKRALGIDVSSWQGTIDWAQIKEQGIEFAIVRVGYRGYKTGAIGYDKMFKYNLEEAKKNNIKVGVYWFTQAINDEEAAEEANAICDKVESIEGLELDLPVVIDYEYNTTSSGGTDGRLKDAKLTKAQATSLINSFCATVEARGYKGMVYSSRSFLQNQMNVDDISDKYQIWIANWMKNSVPDYPSWYTKDYSCWQYGTIALKGIALKENNTKNNPMGVDADYWYLDEHEDYTKCVDKYAREKAAASKAKHYDIRTNGGEWDGVNYTIKNEVKDEDGNPVLDEEGNPIVDVTVFKDCFFCDGTYTYYLQHDGTPMKDRLTYHPDGVHVIYFDEEGHEVFNDFHAINKSIAGEDVDDLCYFDSFGYLYVDVMTYDITGTKLYYVNPCGQIEKNGWFSYSKTAVWAGTNKKVGGGYGYAYTDGHLSANEYLMKDNKKVYIQGNGHMK